MGLGRSPQGWPQFSFPSCKFKVQKSKLGTGRVAMWRLGVSNSYTLEAAFGGSTLGEGPEVPVPVPWGRLGPGLRSCSVSGVPFRVPAGGRSSHFTVRDLTALGAHLCDSLLDLCDPDPAKVGSNRGAAGLPVPPVAGVTPAASRSSSSAWRSSMRSCGGGWAVSRGLLAAGARRPHLSSSPGTGRLALVMVLVMVLVLLRWCWCCCQCWCWYCCRCLWCCW